MLTHINSYKLHGIKAVPVTVECEIASSGIGIHLVGLADAAVRESLLRTVTALECNGYHLPGKKTIINLAPADTFKSGTHYDLAIALAIIKASGQEPLPDSERYVVAGELGLDGSVRGTIPGWIQAAETAKRTGKDCILPMTAARCAAEIFSNSMTIYEVNSLYQAVDILNGKQPALTALDAVRTQNGTKPTPENTWDNIKGHEGAKRALKIAAAGGHPLLMIGPAEAPKEELAKALTNILPPMTEEESLETLRIHAAASMHSEAGVRPFRSPCHLASLAQLLGGGAGEQILPGEVSLAHNGVLFLNNYPLMPKHTLEALRGPLEDGKITISRLRSKVELPARFLPVLSALPCPCGNYGEGDKCTCTPIERNEYLKRLGGTVYDQMTMQAWIHGTPDNKEGTAAEEPAAKVAERIAAARDRQLKRQGVLNEELHTTETDRHVQLNDECRKLLETIMVRMGLSMRAYLRIIKIARSIADLECSDEIKPTHVAEAASYRFLDRQQP